jgi:hypothetical protein
MEIINEIKALALTVASAAEEAEAARAAEDAAEAALLARVVQDVGKRALRAIGTRPLLQSRDTGLATDRATSSRELAEWRGVRMIGDGHSMDYPRSDSGAYKGEALYLREDGSWVRLVYEGTWSRWQGSTSEWTARVEPLTVLEVAQEWSLHSLLETLRDALARAAKGHSKTNAENARARTARVEALLNLI